MELNMKITNLKDASNVSGGKAQGLALLIKMGLPVPNGFVILDTLNMEFNEDNMLQIQNYLSQLDGTKKLAVRSSARALINLLLEYLKLN